MNQPAGPPRGAPMVMPPLTEFQRTGDAKRLSCKCGCRTFMPVQTFWEVSKLVIMNPTGEDVVFNQAGFICTACETFSDGPPEKQEGRKH